jgi:predicted  nucleic acid-binding Zn-ribbon protein
LESNISTSSLKIHELQNELSKAVPRDDLEAVKVQLESKNANLEQKLAASVPKSEADELRNTITELETKLAHFVPKSEEDALSENASRLEATLAETREKLTLTEANRRDLESKLAESVSRTELETAKAAAETRISEL